MTQRYINILLTSLLITVIISSCGKSDKTSYEGIVYEFGTEKPIQGAKLEFSAFIGNPEFGSQPIEYFVDSVFTDKDGKYSFMDTDEDASGYKFNVRANNYFGKDHYSPDIPFHKKGRDNVIDISLDPYAFLTIHVMDNLEIENDYCRVWGDFQGSINIYSGEETKTFVTPGNRFCKIRKKFEDEIDFTIDSVYLEAFEEKTITIEF